MPVYAEGITYASEDYEIADYGSYVLNYPWWLNVMAK